MWKRGMREIPSEVLTDVFGEPNYGSLVDPGPLRSLARSIVEPHRSASGWNLAQAAAIYDFVKRSVAFDREKLQAINSNQPTTVYRPSHTLKLGRGTCGDQALLVASLLAAVSIPCTLIAADTSTGHHLLTILPVGGLDSAGLADAVRRVRGSLGATDHPRVFSIYGFSVAFADTAIGEYLGDCDAQLRVGTIRESRGSGSWRRIFAVYPVRAGETCGPISLERRGIGISPMVRLLPHLWTFDIIPVS